MVFSKLFKKKATTLDAIKMEDLNLQLKALDITERKLCNSLQDANVRQEKLLEDYKVARKVNNEQQALFVSRQYEAVEPEIKGLHSRHTALIQQKRVVQGMVILKENIDFYKEIGGGIFANLELAEIQKMLEDAALKGEITQDTLNALVDTVTIALPDTETTQRNTSDKLSKMDEIAGLNDNLQDKINEGISSASEALAKFDKANLPSQKTNKKETDI